MDDPLPKPALSRWVKWIVAGTALLLLAGFIHSCAGKRKVELPLSAAEAELNRQGVILQEYCRQGVSFDTFSKQLVMVHAALRIAEEDIRRRNGVKWLLYAGDIEVWDATQRVWRRESTGDTRLFSGPFLTEFLAELGDPELSAKIQAEAAVESQGLGHGDGISTARLVRIGLGEGAKRFQDAMEFNEVELAKMKKVLTKIK